MDIDYEKKIIKEVDTIQESDIGIDAQWTKSEIGFLVHLIVPGTKIIEHTSELKFPQVLVYAQLDENYPYRPPRLFFQTDFVTPTIADGRDLLAYVMESQWTPGNTLIDVVDRLPERIAKAFEEAKTTFIGEFHLGEAMLLPRQNSI